jgi:hypothetical protein
VTVTAVAIFVVFALAAAALFGAAVLLALSASRRRVVTRGATSAPARQPVLPPSGRPAPADRGPPPSPPSPTSAAAAVAPPISAAAVAAIPASILAGEDWPASDGAGPGHAPPSFGSRLPAVETAPADRLVAAVELGFEGTTERVGVRPGSSTETAYRRLAQELLGGPRGASRAAGPH